LILPIAIVSFKRFGCSKKERKKERKKKEDKMSEEINKSAKSSSRIPKYPNKGRYVIPKGASVEVDFHHH